MEKLEFVHNPEEGRPTLGVVFHVTHEKEIQETTGWKPIGYVCEVEETEEDHRCRNSQQLGECGGKW